MVSLARRPPGAADIIDLAAARVRDAAGALLTVCAIPIAPAASLAASESLWPHWARPVVITVPLVLAGVLGLVASVLVLGDGGLGHRPPALRTLGRALLLLPRTLLLLVLGLLEVLLFSTLAGVPGAARLGKLQAGLPVLLLERASPVLALRRSRFLTHGAEWLALRAMLGGVAAALALASAPVALLFVAVPLPAGGSEALADTRLLVAATVVGLAVVPVLAAVAFATFLVRREQLEALDLQLALQALDSITPARRPPVTA